MIPYDVCLSLSTSLSMIISRFIHVTAVGIISFFFMATIPLYICTSSFLSIPLLMGFRFLPSLGYCEYSCNEHWGACLFSKQISPDKRPRVRLLDHRVLLFLVFLRNLHTVFHVVVPIYIPPTVQEGSLSLHPLQHYCL